MKFDIYTRLYLAHHKFSSSVENEMFDGCSPVVQNQIIKFAKSLLLFEIHDQLTIVALNDIEKEQFDKFSTNWSIDFKCYFSKQDDIKHVRDGIFETKDGKQLKIYPTVYLDGKPLSPAQAKKIGFEPQSIVTNDLEENYD